MTFRPCLRLASRVPYPTLAGEEEGEGGREEGSHQPRGSGLGTGTGELGVSRGPAHGV